MKIQNKYNLKKCPICGGKYLKLCKNITTRWKRWWIRCCYCGNCSEHTHTRRGAIRKWNKSTNVIAIREENQLEVQ